MKTPTMPLVYLLVLKCGKLLNDIIFREGG